MAAEQTAKKVARLLPLPSVKDIMQLYKVRAMRKLSQNFLLKESLNHKIVKNAGKIKGSEVCEVGPGPGNITRCIIHKRPERVIVIEKDSQFLTTLQMLKDASPVPMKIVHGDVLQFNMENVFSENNKKAWEDDFPQIHIIGNLPFSVATPLIIRWLREISAQKSAWSYGRVRMTLTFQKEVAERMIAPVMTAQRCRLSVMCQNWCDVEYRFTIPGKEFTPVPKVDVGVVHLRPHIKPIIPLPFDLVEKVTTALFSHRKKYCVKGLQRLVPEPQIGKIDQMLKDAEIHPNTRPLQLSVEEIGKLCFGYKKIIDEMPSLKKFDHNKNSNHSDWLSKEEKEEYEIQQWKRKLIEDEFY